MSHQILESPSAIKSLEHTVVITCLSVRTQLFNSAGWNLMTWTYCSEQDTNDFNDASRITSTLSERHSKVKTRFLFTLCDTTIVRHMTTVLKVNNESHISFWLYLTHSFPFFDTLWICSNFPFRRYGLSERGKYHPTIGQSTLGLACNEFGYNDHLAMTSRFLCIEIIDFNVKKFGYNEDPLIMTSFFCIFPIVISGTQCS